MVKLKEMAEVSKTDEERTYLFTSARMTAIWEVAHLWGYTTMKEFWAYAVSQDMTFYDVLSVTSP